MFKNTHKFREVSIFFEKNKCYTKFPKGTHQYIEFWKEEHLKCKYGVEIDGLRISGPHYYYLNYVQILAEDEETGRKRMKFPRFLDIDYDYFTLVERARKEKKGIILLKPRRTGFSYKNAALISHEYNFYRDSKSIIGSFMSRLSETTMKMVLDNVNFLDKNTEWRKQRNPDTKDHIKSRYKENIDGVEVWKGYNSEVQTLTFKDNPFASVGRSTSIFVFEEAGTFENLIQSYNISEPCWKNGENMVGIPIIFGTGGDMEGGTREFFEMFNNPDKYNLLSFPNVWEEGKELTKCGWFVPATKGRLGQFKGQDLVDEDGNSNEELAKESIYHLRESKKSGDPKAVRDIITQYPLTPSEAFLRNKGNIFPARELQEWLSTIETNKALLNQEQIGELYFDSNTKIQFRLNPDLNPIKNFPLDKDDDSRGCIAIYERPDFEGDKNPYGLYIAGCLTPGEKVLTDKGLKNVEEVTLNDYLINKEGEYVSIKNLQRYNKIDEDTFKLKMSNTYRTTNFTKEHPIYTSEQYLNPDKTLNEDKFNFNFKTVDKIKVGEWIKVPNIYKNRKGDFNIEVEDRLKNIWYKPEFWWFIGLWLGDGWCSSTSNTISISFNKNEELYINKLKEIVTKLFECNLNINNKDTNCIEASFNFKELNEFLTKNFGKYCHGKGISEWSKFIDFNLKEQLVLGYLNSDGCILKNKNGNYTTEFVSINLELLESIQDILFSLGIVSSLNKLREASTAMLPKGKIYKTKECYHLRLNYHDTINLIKKYPNIEDHKINKIDLNNLPKKRKHPKGNCFMSKCGEYIYFKIKKIETTKFTGTVYNFECDTHTFMCHHITTHNCDPYDQDKSGTGSLGSFFVYKTFYRADKTYNQIVAEYTGRPEFADEFYENCRKLCIYYNAKCLYENQLKGLKIYFEQKHCLHYLCEQPQIIKDIVKDSKVNRGYGIHMNRGSNGSSGIKDQCEIYLKQWLLEEKENLNGEKILNLHTILSVALLKELIAYDREGNYDRVIAFMLCILQSKEQHKIHIQEIQETWETDKFFSKKLFTKNNNSLY